MPLLTTNLPPNALIGVSLLVILADVIPLPGASTDIGGILKSVESLTLVGALVIAVKVLWDSNKLKDQRILEMASEAIRTNVKVLDAVVELRKVAEEVRDSVESTGNGLDNLTDTMNDISKYMMHERQR